MGEGGVEGVRPPGLAGEVSHEQGHVLHAVQQAAAAASANEHQFPAGPAAGEARGHRFVATSHQRGVPHHQRAVRRGLLHRGPVRAGGVSRHRAAAEAHLPAAAQRAGAGRDRAALQHALGLPALRGGAGQPAHPHHNAAQQDQPLLQQQQLALGGAPGRGQRPGPVLGRVRGLSGEHGGREHPAELHAVDHGERGAALPPAAQERPGPAFGLPAAGRRRLPHAGLAAQVLPGDGPAVGPPAPLQLPPAARPHGGGGGLPALEGPLAVPPQAQRLPPGPGAHHDPGLLRPAQHVRGARRTPLSRSG